MRPVFFLIALAGLGFALPADDKAGDKIDYHVHTGHFEKNNSGLKGESSYLAFTNRQAFDKIFGLAFIAKKKQNFLPKNAFDDHLVAAVIKRGKAVWEYKVDKVTARKATLYVHYQAKAKDSGGAATFATPLILSVKKGSYENVEFIENGKKAGTGEFRK